MKKVLTILVLISSLFTNCQKDNLTEDFFDLDYPSKYCILNNEHRDLLKKQLISDLADYFLVDSFGFVSRNWNQNLGRKIFIGKINSKDSVLRIAKEYIYKNYELVGVIDTSLLEVEEIRGNWVSYGGSLNPDSENDKNRWYVRFKEQAFENMGVHGTHIGIYVCPIGVYSSYGHWYPNIYLPKTEKITFLEAKQKIIGETIGYADWGGSKQWVIKNEDFYTDDISEKWIVPYLKNDCIEMRVCWKIRSNTIWNFYVDTMNGELVMHEQTVIF